MVRTRLPDLVAVAAAQRPAAPALTYQDRTWSYAELWEELRRVAGGLRRLGVARGDRVAVYLDKRLETVAALLGAAAAGAVVVPVNPQLRAPQVAHILVDCGARVLVTTLERLAALTELTELAESPEPAEQVRLPERVVLVGGDTPPGSGAKPVSREAVSREAVSRGQGAVLLSGPATVPFAELSGLEPDVLTPGIDADPAAILYTSGSTGRPKGVVLSHRNLLAGAESVAGYLHNHGGDVILAVLPLSFDAGLSQLTTGFHAGAHVVLMNYLLPRDVVRLCAAHQVTGLTLVPPLWIQLVEQDWPEEATKSLRYFANTGGRMPKTTLDKLRSVFPNAAPYLMYGLTEAFRSTYLDPSEVDRRPDSIGKAIPNAEVMVVRPDGSRCEPGEPGELVHRGALVALGYWNDPDRTAARFRPAPARPAGLPGSELAVWSGDTVVRDEEGFLYFVGRADDMIKTSGYRVSPTEVEEVAYASGLVRDAVAFGRDDPRLGQHIVLAVTAPRGATVDPERLRTELAGQLPRYLLPKEIVVREALPRSANGKFDRLRLRMELA